MGDKAVSDKKHRTMRLYIYIYIYIYIHNGTEFHSLWKNYIYTSLVNATVYLSLTSRCFMQCTSTL